MKALRTIEKRVNAWMLAHAQTPGAYWWLGIIAALEAFIIPLPPSALLIPMVALDVRRRWIYTAVFTTLTSVLGALLGYAIGSLLFDTVGVWIIEQYRLGDEVAQIGALFAKNAFWAVLVAAITPIPYKAFTIASGFFAINISVFVISSFIGRGIRYGVLAYLAYRFGEYTTSHVMRYTALLTLGAVLAIIALGVVGTFL